jgi:DNA-binding NtrC family response regulator
VKTILVVDDDLELLDSLRCLLELDAFRVLQARSCEAAIAHAADGSIDIILLDMVLGPMVQGREGGLDTLLRLQGMTSAPVVAMSGFASSQLAAEALALGAVDFFPKPSDPENIRAIVRRALAKAQSGLTRAQPPGVGSPGRSDSIRGSMPTLEEWQKQHEARYWRLIVTLHGTSATRLATAAGVSTQTVYRKLRAFGLLQEEAPSSAADEAIECSSVDGNGALDK